MSRHRVFTSLRWSDMDAYGHINNVKFLQLLEDARVQALAEGAAANGITAETGLLVARSEIEYLNPLQYRVEPVTIDLWVTRIGAADFDMAFEVLDPADGETDTDTVYARAESLLVAFDLATSRPRRISAPERELLQKWADEPVRWRRRRAPSR